MAARAEQEEEDSDYEDGTIRALPEVFPSELLGWLLLQRSGLDSTERAAILGASGHNLALNNIEEALRLQWSDEDLQVRDAQKSRQSREQFSKVALFGNDASTWDDGPGEGHDHEGDQHAHVGEEEYDDHPIGEV